MGHERLRSGIAALADDAELLRLRRTNWGELRETRWIIVVVSMIQHDLYHAGEINHLRSCIRATTNGSRPPSGRPWAVTLRRAPLTNHHWTSRRRAYGDRVE
jgi:hypothetical protein